jgi:hypothetical protein
MCTTQPSFILASGTLTTKLTVSLLNFARQLSWYVLCEIIGKLNLTRVNRMPNAMELVREDPFENITG